MLPEEEFSLLNLAEALGVSSQSLYHYFPSKEAIFEAIAEEIAEDVPVVSGDLHWRDYIRQTILMYHEWLLSNDFPIARNYVYEGIATFRVASRRSENLLKRFDTLVAVLDRDGFEVDQTVAIWIAVSNFIRRSDLHRATQRDLDSAWSELLVDIGESEEGQFPQLEALVSMARPNFEDVYRGLIETLIEGISARYGVK